MKEFLVLGNGFDLAHYLPTLYIHFMEVMDVIESCDERKSLGFDDLFRKRINEKDTSIAKTKAFYRTDNFELSAERVGELREKLRRNRWYKHFKKHLTDSHTSWIDFEKEIESVLNLLADTLTNQEEKELFEGYRERLEEGYYFCDGVSDNPEWNAFIRHQAKLIKDLGFILEIHKGGQSQACVKVKQEYVSITASGVVYFNSESIFSTLVEDLYNFNDIFSCYIKHVVDGLLDNANELKSCDEIRGASSILSSNYSNTVHQLYAPLMFEPKNLYHLHGKASASIVLGISELAEKLMRHNKTYSFTKAFQKIKFVAQKEFLLESLAEHEENIYITFWGHSLDISDKPYIEEAFTIVGNVMKQVSFPLAGGEYLAQLKIYYHGSVDSVLANLMQIMGQDVISDWHRKGWLVFQEAPEIELAET